MKKIIFLGILLCLTLTSYAQNIHIPDANFKNALLASSINTNNDGNISKHEAEKAVSINAVNKNIENLTGIEHFINLKYLTIPKNKVTSLNLTKNTKLQYLYVSQNQLTNLNISACTQLERLDANNNQLAQLDVSKNVKLFELKIISNRFKRLNIDHNARLSILHAWNNQLEELNITKNLNLTRLFVWGNKLKRLDVSKNTKLYQLNIGNNLLTTIDASKNKMLDHIDVRESLLTTIKLPVTSTLKHITVNKNNLKSIDLTGNPNLERLYIGSNQLTSIDLSKNVNLVLLNCSKNKISKLDARNCKIVYLDVNDNSELKTMFLTHQSLNKFIKIEKCPKLEFICLHKYYSDTAYIQNRVNALGYNCVISSDCSLAPTTSSSAFDDHFILSPNPASNYLAITPKHPLTTGNATVTILRLSGEIVKKVVVKFAVDSREELIQEDPFAAPIPIGTNDILMGLNSVLIDVTGLPVGLYILHLQSSKRLLTTIFIKN